MNRAAGGAGKKIIIVASVFALAALAPVRVWAADDDDSDESSRLIVMADFNRDGIVDMAEAILPAGSGPGLLTVSLGQANGGFKPLESRPVLGHAPRSIVTADFNGDGIPDVIVGDDDGSLKLFLGNGTGNLVPAGDIARVDSVVSIAVADFNHDGIPDIAVSDWRASSVIVFLGAGNDSFQRMWSFPLRMKGVIAHVAAADFNGDGIPDLAITYEDDAGYTYEVMLGDGKGAFTDAPSLGFRRDPNSYCPT